MPLIRKGLNAKTSPDMGPFFGPCLKRCARGGIGSFDKDQSTINCKLIEESQMTNIRNIQFLKIYKIVGKANVCSFYD